MAEHENHIDPWRYETRVHYRLFRSYRDNQPTVVCLQDFDYYDMAPGRFLSTEGWFDEDEAEQALTLLVSAPPPGLAMGAIATDDIRRGDLVRVLVDPRNGMAHVVKYTP